MVDGLGRLDGWQSVVGGAMEYSVLEGSVEALTIGTGVSCSNVEYETVNSECPLNDSVSVAIPLAYDKSLTIIQAEYPLQRPLELHRLLDSAMRW